MGDDDRLIYRKTFGRRKSFHRKRKQSSCAQSLSDRNNYDGDLNNEKIFSNTLLSLLELRQKQIAEMLSSYCSVLSAVKYRIEAAMLYMESKPKKSIDILYPGVELIQDAITEMDDITIKLYPMELEKLGFVRTVGSLIENFGAADRVIHFTSNLLNNESKIPKYLQVNIYLAAKELLDYIFQATESESVSIELNECSRHIEFTIKEDTARSGDAKQGNEPSLKSTNSLEMARLRISLSEGSIDIKGALSSGRYISARWPYDMNRDEGDAHQ